MDEIPRYVTSADWADIGSLLVPFWVLVFAVLGFAGSMLLAQAVIPSLKDSRDLPDPRLASLRPPLYLGAVAFLALVVMMVVAIADRLDVIGDLFPRWLV